MELGDSPNTAASCSESSTDLASGQSAHLLYVFIVRLPPGLRRLAHLTNPEEHTAVKASLPKRPPQIGRFARKLADLLRIQDRKFAF